MLKKSIFQKREVKILINILVNVKMLVNILINIVFGVFGIWLFTSSLMEYYFYPTLIIKITLGLLCSITLGIYLGYNTKSKLIYFVVGYLVSFITYIIILSTLLSRALGPINGY